MKTPENAREQIEDVRSGTAEGSPSRLICDLALRALDYEAASGEVTEEMVAVAKARLHEGNAHSRLSAADVRRALLAVTPLLSAAARRKALEEAEALLRLRAVSRTTLTSLDRALSQESEDAATALRALGRPA